MSADKEMQEGVDEKPWGVRHFWVSAVKTHMLCPAQLDSPQPSNTPATQRKQFQQQTPPAATPPSSRCPSMIALEGDSP
eukprot:3939987-Rhodomonas_salina.1